MKVKDYYTTGEVARIVGVAVNTVSLWCKKGKIRALLTAGGQYRIPRSEVERLLSRTNTGEPLEVIADD